MKLYRKKNTKNRRIGPGELDCAGARDLMFSELDHENSAAESQALHRHLDGCEACRKEFNERREMIDMINNSAWDVPVKLVPNVMSLIDSVPQDGKNDRIIECGHGKQCKTVKANKKKGVFSHRSSFASFGTVAAACAVVMIVLFNRGFIDGASGSVADVAEHAYSLQSPVYKSAPNVEEPNDGASSQTNYYTDIEGASYDSFSVDDGGGNNDNDNAKKTSPDLSETGTEAAEDRSSDWDFTPDFSLAGIANAKLDLYDILFDDAKKEYPDSAIIVCDESVLGDDRFNGYHVKLDKKIIKCEQNRSDQTEPKVIWSAEVCNVSIGSSELAEQAFSTYLDILEKSGEPFESDLPVGSEYTDICLVLVNGTAMDGTELEDCYTIEIEQPADEPEDQAGGQ